MQRRIFFKYSVLLSSFLFPTISTAMSPKQDKNRVTVAVCGAGFGGLSVAKYLKELNKELDVVVIEKNPSFISCPLSNAYLGEVEGFEYESLLFGYDTAIKKYKYRFVNEEIVDINRDKKLIQTTTLKIKYDYMVMALGIEYNYKKIFKRDKEKARKAQIIAPAGLKPGRELFILKQMIENFKGGNFILTIPSQQFKCPSAPYERACMIANYFKKKNIAGKVIIIDPRVKPASKPEVFLKAYKEIYPDIIEYHNLTNFEDVDFEKKIITTEVFDKKSLDYIKNEIRYEELSIIPANKANKLYKKAGIKTYAQGWVKLRKPTFKSVSDEDVYVIGDAQGEYPYPKSAQMANSQALLVAQDLTARLEGLVFDYKKNMPGNVCYSVISEKKAASITHFYEYKNKIEVSYDISNIDTYTLDAAKSWYRGLTNDIFGI